MAMVDSSGTPLFAYAHSIGFFEVHGIETLVDERRLYRARTGRIPAPVAIVLRQGAIANQEPSTVFVAAAGIQA